MRFVVATLVVLMALSSTPAQECKADIDCVDRSKSSVAGLCSDFMEACDNETAPWTPQVHGNITGFCSAYMNGCSAASLTLTRGGKKVTVQIEGPGAFKAESCTLEVASGTSSVSSGSAGRIADSVQACVHNAPVYFFRTMEATEKGSNFCCGYPF